MQKIKEKPWMKTNSGFKCPSESLLPGLNWDHLLNIVPLPVDDKEYYGRRIGSYRAELEAIGVVVDLDGAMGIQNSFLYTLSQHCLQEVLPAPMCSPYSIASGA